MVQVRRQNERSSVRVRLWILFALSVLLLVVQLNVNSNSSDDNEDQGTHAHMPSASNPDFNSSLKQEQILSKSRSSSSSTSSTSNEIKAHQRHNLNHNHKCQYKSYADLKPYETTPTAIQGQQLDPNGRRHMVTPPADTLTTLVCCSTTKGPLSIAVHHAWAPLGAQRFVDMVNDKYFESKVAMMRCIHNFLCQFGIAGIPSYNKKYKKSLKDDVNWMPKGPKFMTNEYGTKRYAKGYFGYAGGGENSRGNQFIVALGDHKRLGGGSPWEVPFGEAVGLDSYETLGKIETTYGEKGPNQGRLGREGSSEAIAKEFPKLDYITECVVVDVHAH